MESAPTDAHESSTSGLHHRSPSISAGSGNTSPGGRQSKRTLSNAGAHHPHPSHHHCHSTHQSRHHHHHHHSDHHRDHILHHTHGQQHPLSDLESEELHHRCLAHAPSSPSLAPVRHTSAQSTSHSAMMSGQFASSSASAFHPAESVGAASQASASSSASASSPSASSSVLQVTSSNPVVPPATKLLSEDHSINGADNGKCTETRECGKGDVFEACPSYSQPSTLVSLCRASGSSKAAYGTTEELQRREAEQTVSVGMHMENLLQNYNATSFGLPLHSTSEGQDSSLSSLYESAEVKSGVLRDEKGKCSQPGVESSDDSSSTPQGQRAPADLRTANFAFPPSLEAHQQDSLLRRLTPQTPPASPSKSPSAAMWSHLSLKRQLKSRQWARVHSTEQRNSRRTGWELTVAHPEASGSPTPRGWRLPVWRDEERRRRKPSTQSQVQTRDEGGCINVSPPAIHQKEFHLQPVPRSKRRRLQGKPGTADKVVVPGINPLTGTFQGPPGKHACEALTSPQPNREATQIDVSLNRVRGHEDGVTTNSLPVVPTSNTAVTTSVAALPSTQTKPLVEEVSVTSNRSVLAPLDSTIAACDRGPTPQQDATSIHAKGLVAPRCPSSSSRHRRGQLKRSQSLPNMRVRQDFDPSRPAKHRFVTPYHLSRSLISSRSGMYPSGQAIYAPPHGSRPKIAHHAGSIARPTVWTPPIMPPITRATLRELDLHEIVKNPQLRHDIVFDAHVQFRPNFDGERGRRKREACERYWTAVTREIETGCICTTFDGNRVLPCICLSGKVDPRIAPGKSLDADRAVSTARPGLMPSRLPTLILELRAICLSVLPNPANSPVTATASSPWLGSSTLPSTGFSLPSGPGRAVRVPTTFFSGPATTSSSHYAVLAAGLDPALISQQLHHGVLNVSELVQFVASILKLHCAPMRDDLIEQMVSVTQRGQVGQGLRMCFEILELMKLDIANHQLRSTRPWLVNTAVEFEARWFRDQVTAGKIGTLQRTIGWIRQGWQEVEAQRNRESTPHSSLFARAFTEAFIRLIVDPPLAGSTPGTTDAAAETPRTATTPVSSSLLNFTYSVAFPETFQFDAYRMITFHNEVVDMSVMYMLLLLYRQLACSPAIASPDSTFAGARVALAASKASGLAQRRLESVKAEISCLLNDANATTPGLRSPTAVCGGSTGFNKLKDPKWLDTLRPALLQVAARAGAAWDEAQSAVSDTSTEGTPATTRVPNAQTIAMLDRWAKNQLNPDSALMKMCISKLKGVLSSYIMRKVGPPPRTRYQGKRSGDRAAASGHKTENTSGPTLVVRKRASTESGDSAVECSSKRRKADSESHVASQEEKDEEARDADAAMSPSSSCASIAELSDRVIHPCGSPRNAMRSLVSIDGEQSAASIPARSSDSSEAAMHSNTVEEDWDVLVSKAGLESLKVELQSLGARLTQVATMNIKTFRSLYEVILSPQPDSPGVK